jgi:hypothetical protein
VLEGVNNASKIDKNVKKDYVKIWNEILANHEYFCYNNYHNIIKGDDFRRASRLQEHD